MQQSLPLGKIQKEAVSIWYLANLIFSIYVQQTFEEVCMNPANRDSSPLTPGTFDDVNPDARILTPDP